MSTMPPEAPWVLLRGLSREAQHWGEVPQQLQARTGRAVHCIDLPGNGVEWQRASPVCVRDMALHVRQRLQAQGVTGPVHVVGLSMGAMVAVDWATAWPNELCSLVLINSSLRGFSAWHQRLRLPAVVRLLGLLLSPASDERWESTLFDLTSRCPALREATVADWLAIRRAHPVTRLNALRQLLAAARYRAPAQAPRVPLLVLSGAGDQLVSPACSATMAAHWQAPHRVHLQAGHDLPLDAPEWLLQELIDWAAMPHKAVDVQPG